MEDSLRISDLSAEGGEFPATPDTANSATGWHGIRCAAVS